MLDLVQHFEINPRVLHYSALTVSTELSSLFKTLGLNPETASISSPVKYLVRLGLHMLHIP